MRIKNTMEDLVYNLVETIIYEKKETLPQSPKFKLDVVCFVLNRIKPNYVVSSRGMAHMTKELEEDYQIVADIISKIYEGINLVRSRRRYVDEETEGISWDVSYNLTKEYYYNFPQLIGKVYDADSFDLVHDAKVTLLDENDKIIQMNTPLWKNPYQISKSTAGIYTFWPKSLRAKEDEEGLQKQFAFKILVEHENYLKEQKVFTFDKKSEQMLIDYIRKGDMFDISPIYLSKKS